jgi:hypothetical protein
MADEKQPEGERQGLSMPGLLGDPRFFALLSELAERHSEDALAHGIHDADSAGFHDDPISNVRYASPDFGIEPWVYSLMCANDHLRRLQAFVVSDLPTDRDLRSSFLNVATFALTALVLFEEESSDLFDFEEGHED